MKALLCSLLMLFLLSDQAQAGETGVLFTGHRHHRCGYEMAKALHADGFAVNTRTVSRGLMGAELTWDELRQYHTIVLMGMGLSLADQSLTPQNRNNVELLHRFLREGGGILFVPTWCQDPEGFAAQRAFAGPLGLEILFDEQVMDPGTEVAATAWRIPFAHTNQIQPSPFTGNVTSLWYPSSTRAGHQVHTCLFGIQDEAWKLAVKGSASSYSRTVPLDRHDFGSFSEGRFDASVPLVAYREWGKGRVVVLSITPEYLIEDVAGTTLEEIVRKRGLKGVKSDGYLLVRDALRWLAEPALKEETLGGATMQAQLLEDPYKVKWVGPTDWSKPIPEPRPFPALRGAIGARTAASSGSGSVEQWVQAAKEQGLDYLIFLEEMTEISPAEFEALKQACAAASSADFAAIPGITAMDEIGNHYFFCGTNFLYPPEKMLSEDGKRFVSYDPGLNPADPREPRGQLSMTILHYVLSYNHAFTPGNYLFRQDAAPVDDWFSNYTAVGVITRQNGELLEDITSGYLDMVDSGQGPLPLAIELMDDPAQLADLRWQTVLRLPPAAPDAAESPVPAYFNQRQFYPANPVRIHITEGPDIVDWSFVGTRDYEGNNRGDFVWQNYRWLVRGTVASEVGLHEVAVYDGPHLFRRFLCGGEKSFTFTLDMSHDEQHNLVLIATDVNNRRAISGDQWDRNHRIEEFMCSDRNNQLSYGFVPRSDGTFLMLGGNQPLATPNKRIAGMAISPSGTFKNDPRLGAPAFDGGAFTEPMVFMNPQLKIGDGLVSSPGGLQAFRLMHSRDANIGQGEFRWRFEDDIRVANVWHTLWKVTEADDFTVIKRNHFFQIDPDSPVAVFLWQLELTAKRDLDASSCQVGFIRAGDDRLWAIRGADGGLRAGLHEAENMLSQRRSLRVPLGVGGYAALLDSSLGSGAVFPLTEGVSAEMSLPGHGNIVFWLDEDKIPRRAGETARIDLLLVGVPRLTPVTANISAASTETFENFRLDFGIGVDQPRYRADLRSGRAISRMYPLIVDGSESGAMVGRLSGKLVSSLPILVQGLNDRWSSFLYDGTVGKARPLATFERKAWATVVVGEGSDLFIGQPVTASQPDVFLLLTQVGEEAWRLELHNPTNGALEVGLKVNPAFPPLAGVTLPPQPIVLQAGSSQIIDL